MLQLTYLEGLNYLRWFATILLVFKMLSLFFLLRNLADLFHKNGISLDVMDGVWIMCWMFVIEKRAQLQTNTDELNDEIVHKQHQYRLKD